MARLRTGLRLCTTDPEQAHLPNCKLMPNPRLVDTGVRGFGRYRISPSG